MSVHTPSAHDVTVLPAGIGVSEKRSSPRCAFDSSVPSQMRSFVPQLLVAWLGAVTNVSTPVAGSGRRSSTLVPAKVAVYVGAPVAVTAWVFAPPSDHDTKSYEVPATVCGAGAVSVTTERSMT